MNLFGGNDNSNKFIIYYGTRRSYAAFTRNRHCNLDRLILFQFFTLFLEDPLHCYPLSYTKLCLWTSSIEVLEQ
jgi:hypothetical protein